MVGIPSPEERVFNYPHQMSGGMRQRVMIAIALSLKPDLLIADEPTTALDVTTQAQIIDLLKTLQQELKMGIILITHDLAVVAETCDRIAVMYAGQIVEEAFIKELFYSPRHPYTLGLLRSIPGFNKDDASDGRPRLRTIPGLVQNLYDFDVGCRFYDRCTARQDRCLNHDIDLIHDKDGIKYRCLFPNDINTLYEQKRPLMPIISTSTE